MQLIVGAYAKQNPRSSSKDVEEAVAETLKYAPHRKTSNWYVEMLYVL